MKKFWYRSIWYIWKKPLIFIVRKTFPGGFATDLTVKDGTLKFDGMQGAFIGYSKFYDSRTEGAINIG